MPPPANPAASRPRDDITACGTCVALLSALNIGCVIPISSTSAAPPPADSGGPSGDTGGDHDLPGDAGGDVTVPIGAWINVTGSLAKIPSVCGAVADISVKPDEDVLIAGVGAVGLWASRDGGGWQELGKGTDSAMVTNRMSSIVYDPKDSNRFWESGIYGPGIYETTDDGNTFVQLGTVTHCDLLSIDLSDPKRQTMLAGGHEEPRTLYRSMDGGMTWTNIGGTLPATPYCTLPVLIDTQTYLVGCYGSGPTGVYRTTDGGATWTQVSKSGGGGGPLFASDKSIYWTTENNQGLARSTDNGQHWTDVTGPGVITNKTPLELPDGKLAALGTEYILVSADRGATWTPATSALPVGTMEMVYGFTYSPKRKAFLIWQNQCANGTVPVTSDAVMRYDFGG